MLSGRRRSLHAQEIQYNDIRATLQALSPALIAKILGHVQACDAAVGPDARAPPGDM